MNSSETSTPFGRGYAMPAEWYTHAATWMSWPFDDSMWFGQLEEVRHEYSALVKEIARCETVHLVVRDTEAEQSAQEALKEARNVIFHKVALDDVWMRDNGPNFVLSTADHKLKLINWQFNAWGGKYDWEQDNLIPEYIARFLKVDRWDPNIIMEGGSLDLDGQGLCLTTEQCLLTPTRNAHLSKTDLEKILRDFLGIKQLIWLHKGLEGDHTDGHIDTITRFAAPGLVLSSVTSDRSDLNWQPMQENLEILRSTQLAEKKQLNVVELPLPANRYELADGQRLPATYANFYIANGTVIVPQYRDPNDQKALEVIKSVFPDRRVIGLSSRAIICGGGSFHCLTQQQPALTF